MWSIIFPATLQASRAGVNGFAAVTVGRSLGLSSRLALNRSASSTYRVVVQARYMAAAAQQAKTKKKPATPAKKPAAKKATTTKKTVTAKAKAKAKPSVSKSKSAEAKAKAKAKEKAARAKAKERAKEKAAKEKAKARAKTKLSPEAQKRANIKEWRQTALLSSEPTKLPVQRLPIFVQKQLKGTEGVVTHLLATVAKSFTELPESELQALAETAEKNKQANAAAYKVWVESHTPAQIYQANLARTRLRTAGVKKARKIEDSRLPKRRVTPFSPFFAMTARDNPGKSAIELSKLAGEGWRALSPAERKPFVDEAAADWARYQKELKAVLGKAS